MGPIWVVWEWFLRKPVWRLLFLQMLMKSFLSIAILLICFGCTHQSDKSEVKITITNNALALPVSNQTANISNGLQGCHFAGRDYLASLN